MNDEQLLRYSRQIMLPEIDVTGQRQLADAHVLIIGMGGLGSPAAMYLAASGVGKLTLVDFDTVEASNLQRQIIHREADVGSAKVDSAAHNLRTINSELHITGINTRPDDKELTQLVRESDVVIDASDNYATRFAVNAACVRQRVPLVSGAAIRFEGQLSVFDKRSDDSPCYNCLYTESGDEEETCSENGILAPVVGTIGSMQAVEAIKIICGIGETLVGRLLVFDALSMNWRSMRLKRDPACPVCGAQNTPSEQ